VLELLDRALGLADYSGEDLSSGFALDDQTMEYLEAARDLFGPIVGNLRTSVFGGIDMSQIGEDPEISEIVLTSGQIINAINYIGSYSVLEDIYKGARYIYKATQVANISKWEDATQLAYKKAYEARNKIRLAIAELLVMPRDAILTMPQGMPSGTVNFDSNLVVKQIITFSPEDDLDNGPERADVFPYGIQSVDIGGVGMDSLGGEGSGDAILTDADRHFSHAPISNGVFSKNGTNFVEKVTPDDEAYEQFFAFMSKTSIRGMLGTMHDALVGGCMADLTDLIDLSESCLQVTYQDFLYVAF